MATRNAIDRLSQRTDALAARSWRRTTLDCLTEEAWAKVRRLAPNDAGPRTPTGCEQWSDADIIRRLVELGVLTKADFR
jgi:hypothetical protein